jgi:DNA polymerase III delta prime subunit
MGGKGQRRFRNLEHMIIETLSDAGATHVSFNPLTQRTCIKQLKRIANAEGLAISDEALSAITESSRCDLYNSIQSLWMHAVGMEKKRGLLGKAARGTKGKKAKDEKALGSSRQQRDMGLHLFHALGKILYNKRFSAAGEQVPVGARCDAALCLCAYMHAV